MGCISGTIVDERIHEYGITVSQQDKVIYKDSIQGRIAGEED